MDRLSELRTALMELSTALRTYREAISTLFSLEGSTEAGDVHRHAGEAIRAYRRARPLMTKTQLALFHALQSNAVARLQQASELVEQLRPHSHRIAEEADQHLANEPDTFEEDVQRMSAALDLVRQKHLLNVIEVVAAEFAVAVSKQFIVTGTAIADLSLPTALKGLRRSEIIARTIAFAGAAGVLLGVAGFVPILSFAAGAVGIAIGIAAELYARRTFGRWRERAKLIDEARAENERLTAVCEAIDTDIRTIEQLDTDWFAVAKEALTQMEAEGEEPSPTGS